MERKFYTDSFERLLKEDADQFTMKPSKKVWHGIYNDLHPGKRWPSIAMSLMFLFTLVIIGHLNTNNDYKKSTIKYPLTLSSNDNNNSLKNSSVKKTKQKEKVSSSDDQHSFLADIINSTQPNLSPTNNSEDNNVTPTENSQETIKNNNSAVTIIAEPAESIIKVDKSTMEVVTIPTSNKSSLPAAATEIKALHNNQSATIKAVNKISLLNNTSVTQNEEDENVSKSVSNSENKNSSTALLKPQEKANAKLVMKKKLKEQEDAEDAQREAAAAIRLKNRSKMNWVYYFTPAISYRKLSGQEISNNTIAALTNVAPSQVNSASINNSVVNHPGIGFEAGGDFTYKLSKKLKFISGLQLDYFRYGIRANNTHPVTATLLLNSEDISRPYVISSVSQYGNGTGPAEITLHSISWQASLPLGLQYTFAGNDKIEFSVAGTVAPSYMIDSKAYLLSTDKRNYITESTLSRKWNVTSDFGTYVSFKSNSFTWQIGPQFHYQLLSTFSKNYPISEHLINYGVRFGISKNLN